MTLFPQFPQFPQFPLEEIERDYTEVNEIFCALPGETKKIYEIKKYEHYILVYRKSGQPVKQLHAHSELVLLLRHGKLDSKPDNATSNENSK